MLDGVDLTDDFVTHLADLADDCELDYDTPVGEVLRLLLVERKELRACLDNTREEICEGPVDDVLWHTAIPACTTVDNISLVLGDGWTYDGWLDAKSTDHSSGESDG